MTRKQQMFMRTEINIAMGKNEGYMPSSLGSRSISVQYLHHCCFCFTLMTCLLASTTRSNCLQMMSYFIPLSNLNLTV